jgi:hypothetical protein
MYTMSAASQLLFVTGMNFFWERGETTDATRTQSRVKG